MGGNYNYLVRIPSVLRHWLSEAHTVAVLRNLRPGLLERYRRPGQQMAAFCFGTPKHRLRQDGPKQGPILVQLQFRTRPRTFGLAGVDPGDRSAIISSNQLRSDRSVVRQAIGS
jgi:hypothetical protein